MASVQHSHPTSLLNDMPGRCTARVKMPYSGEHKPMDSSVEDLRAGDCIRVVA
jgi:hypothetical protein